jgi:hypothetical protein
VCRRSISHWSWRYFSMSWLLVRQSWSIEGRYSIHMRRRYRTRIARAL